MVGKWEEVGEVKNTMLIGEYTHTLDDKSRVSIPAKFRKELGNKVVVTNGLDTCLFVFSLSAWNRFSEQLASLSFAQGDKRKFSRFMLGGAVEVEVDSIGRVLLPEFLKKFAGLNEKVVITGIHDRVEIWNDRSWAEYKKNVEKDVDILAEKLGEVGAL